MKGSKGKAKIIGLVMLSLFIQGFIVAAILSSGNEKGYIEDIKSKYDDVDDWNYQYSEEDELDVIERAKKGNYDKGEDIGEQNEEDKTEGISITEVNSTGRVSVDLSFDPGVDSKKQDQKVKNDKVKSSNKVQMSKKTTIYSIDKVKEMAIGKWKGVNNSNGKYNDVYIEFFADGSYEKHGENKENIHKGKYIFSSPDKIKITYENAESDDTGWNVKENESFIADIDFKDEDNFTVKDINRFSFANYKKIK